ncbi:MAG: hypothetical protein SFV32_06195 [Opitutaceae bacterium]|nr:hypothetical protein [Opitutaceae bacterium]
MALWEYKVITSGQHGFATPALLEAHLNALGKDEWEIIHFQTLPNNPLAFNGLVRRSTMRDWTPPVVVQAAPAPAPAPSRPAPAELDSVPARPAAGDSVVEEKPVVDDKAPLREETFRPVRNTDRDLDPEAEDEEDDWDEWEEDEDELPTFFEAVKPHMRRNQKGPGMAVGVDYLAKRWELREADVVNALKECGLTIPESEETDPEYFEFEGDLFWVNRNNRGQLFLNTREKPRPVFRAVPASKLSADDPAAAELSAERAAEKAEIEKRNQERAQREAERQAAAQARAEAQAAARAARQAAQAAQPTDGQREEAPAGEASADAPVSNEPASDAPAPTGAELLERIRPHMRRNRRGPGYSGSSQFLSRALKCSEKSLVEAFAALGLEAPANAGAKPVNVEIGNAIFWMNRDGRGGLWINGRENRGQRQASPAQGEPSAAGPEGAQAIPTDESLKPAGDKVLGENSDSNPGAQPAAPGFDQGAAGSGSEGSPVSEAVATPEVGAAGQPEETPPPAPTAAEEKAPSPSQTAPLGEVAPETPVTTGEPEASESTEPTEPTEDEAADDAPSESKEGAKPKKRVSRPRVRKPKVEPGA